MISGCFLLFRENLLERARRQERLCPLMRVGKKRGLQARILLQPDTVALTRVICLQISANMHHCAYDYVWKNIPLVYEQIGGISSASGTERPAVVSCGLPCVYCFLYQL